MKPYLLKNKEELWTILKHEWEGIGRNVTSKLVDSALNRWNEVVKNKGGSTLYGKFKFVDIYLFFLTCLCT